MTYSQKYTLVHFISPIKTNAQFHMPEWPLHVTLADVFAIERHTTNIDASLKSLLAGRKPTTTVGVNEAVLGTASVVLLDKTVGLLNLHADIIALLEANGAIFNHPEFTKNGFIPHSTIQKNESVAVGEKIVIDSVSLVDMFPGGDWQERKVLATFNLR